MVLGARIANRFVVDTQVGQGGMGTVYRARDEQTGELVAIKIVREATERFDREADLLARLEHPGIVRHIAHGRTDAGEHFLAMQWLEGEDLQQRLARGSLEIGEVIELGRITSVALAEIHARGVVHRDIKPSNIWLVDGRVDRPVLLDFGIARPVVSRLTMTGHVVGTPQYMAPEQIQSPRDIDARVDVYALGVVLFECIVGRPPFLGDNAIAVLAKVLLESVPLLRELRPDTPAPLANAIQRALSKRRDDRQPDARTLAAELDRVPTGQHLIERPARNVVGIGATERRLVCVVIVDAAAIADTLPPDVQSEELARTRILANAYGMQMMPFAGGYVAMSTSSGVATDHARRAARYALSAAAELPSAAVALATGWGTVDPVPIGEAIDRAAVLLQRGRAPGTGVRVDDTTASLLELAYEIGRDDRGHILLGERRGERPRTLLGRTTSCVGRDRDLRTLEELFAEVRDDGVARAALVTAPAGGGKSRIRHELLARLARTDTPPTIALAHAEMLRAGSPLDLLARCVRSLVGIDDAASGDAVRDAIAAHVRERIPEATNVAEFLFEIVGAPLAAGASATVDAARADARTFGDRMLEAWLALIAAHCASGPCVLVLEDLHWGDPQTVRFLDAALRDLVHAPLFVLAFARTDVHDRFPGLWRERPLQEVRLGALPPKACARLVRDVLPDLPEAAIERIVAHCEGNAFFLEEMIRASASGAAPAPASVVAMVQARLDALDADSRRVVRAASVFGEACQRDGVAAVLGSDPQSLDTALARLVTAEVMVRRPGDNADHAFRHALVREAAYSALTDEDRRYAHAAAARWLEDMQERDALLLAGHYDAAGDRANAARCWAEAAHQALEKNDFDAALSRATRAVELGPSEEVRLRALIALGRTYVCLGRWQEAQRELEAALAMAPEPADRIELLRDMFRVGVFRQDSTTIRRVGDEALAIAKTLDHPQLVSEASAALAAADHGDGNCDVAIARYLEACETSGRSTFVHGLSGIILYHTARFDECLHWNSVHLRQATEMRDSQAISISHANVAVAHAARGEYELAEEHFARSREAAERAGLTSMLARAVSVNTGWQVELFDYEGARHAAEEAQHIGRHLEFSTPRISAALDLAAIAVRQQLPTDAEQLLEPLAEIIATHSGFHGWLWRLRNGVLRAEIAASRGQHALAVDLARKAAEHCDHYRRAKYAIQARCVLARMLVATDQPDEAFAALAHARTEAARCGDPSWKLQVELAAIACGQRDALGDAARFAAGIENALPQQRASAFRASPELAVLG